MTFWDNAIRGIGWLRSEMDRGKHSSSGERCSTELRNGTCGLSLSIVDHNNINNDCNTSIVTMSLKIMEPPKMCAFSNKQVLRFFTKGGRSFRRFICNRELLPYCWLAYRESMFANIELRFSNKKLLVNY